MPEKKGNTESKINQRTSIVRNLRQWIFILFLLIFSLTLVYSRILNHSNNFTQLKIPQKAQVYLPSPLWLEHIMTNVLGTEAIDPFDIVTHVNIEREKRGASSLRLNPTLTQAAQRRADVILKHQNFSHQDPYENIELTTILPSLNYRFRYASENIGMGGLSGKDFVNGFMSSTSHRENLLNPYLTETGIAVVTGPYQQFYVNIAVQLFAIPAGQEEYLGYNQIDKKNYQNILSKLNFQLNPINWRINKILDKGKYTESYHRQLLRQKEIIATLYERMKKDQPLENEHIVLIREYNQNL